MERADPADGRTLIRNMDWRNHAYKAINMDGGCSFVGGICVV